jgi:tetratricopeptide (TPR) repeat protein
VNQVQFYLDTAYVLAGTMERPAEARAVIARGLAKVPLSKLAASERPYGYLARLAARSHDPALARMAAQGWEKDQRTESPDAVGGRAFYAAQVALAEQRWEAVIPQVLEADKRATINWRYAFIALAQAHDNAGRADSAIAYFEKFVTTRGQVPDLDAEFRAGSHKRLGELYDAKGNTAKAVEHFEKFVEMWKNAEPELQPKVREAQDKLKRLRALKG